MEALEEKLNSCNKAFIKQKNTIDKSFKQIRECNDAIIKQKNKNNKLKEENMKLKKQNLILNSNLKKMSKRIPGDMLRIQTLLKEENKRLQMGRGTTTVTRINKKIKEMENNMLEEYKELDKTLQNMKELLKFLNSREQIKVRNKSILKDAYKNKRIGKINTKKLEKLETIYEQNFSNQKIVRFKDELNKLPDTLYNRIIDKLNHDIKKKEKELSQYVEKKFEELDKYKNEMYNLLKFTQYK